MLQHASMGKMRLELALKRVLDVVGSAVLLAFLAPLMAMILVLVKRTSPGPAIFCQTRAGLLGKPFTIYKFRTMVVGAGTMGAGLYMVQDDPRITRVGRLLRTYSLDELPELWNVLKGDMSLVGPRPTLLYQVEMYDATQRLRLSVRPGITGLAQVEGRNELRWSERIKLDLKYIDGWSLVSDIRILLRTVGVVVTRAGVRQDQSREEIEDLGR